jgi:Asp-tRNA(Asn)/Glu-tRNA(Gln) amidotransferase A subunit family amidase
VNGIVGIKPTVGLVSRRGIVPISHSQDTAGAMGRRVADAVALLDAMIGEDEQDPATEVAAAAASWTLVRHLREEGLQGKRIGVLRSETGYHEGVDRLFEAALGDLVDAGAELVDDLAFDPPPGFNAATYELLLYEFKHDLNAYLASLPDEQLSTLTLADLIAFNREHADAELRWFQQEIFEKAEAKGPLTDEAYVEARALILEATRERGIDRLVAEHELDLLVAPSGSAGWSIDLINGDHFLGSCSTYPAVAGYPHVTVPMGRLHDLPVGLSFIAPAKGEPTLIEAAYAYEQATRHWGPPLLEAESRREGGTVAAQR